MSSITFSGLASGLNSSDIINKLVELERAPITALEKKKSDATKQNSILTDFISRLKSVQFKAQALDKAEETQAIKTSSTDESKVKVSASSTAVPGQFSVRVNRLASAETRQSRGFATQDSAATGGETLDISIGAGAPVSVPINAGDTLQNIADRINTSISTVNASVIFDGSQFRMIVNSKQTGASNAITFAGAGASLLGMNDPGGVLVTAQDAELVMNGLTITRPSNIVDNAVSGVTFELRSVTGATDPDTRLTVERDNAPIQSKIQGLVDTFNDLSRQVSGQLNFVGVKKGTDTLFGDSTLQNLQRRLGTLLSTVIPTATGNVLASQIGLSMSKDGTMSFDSSKLSKAIAENPSIVKDLFVGVTEGTGLAAVFNKLITDFTDPTNGLIAIKQKSLSNKIKGIDAQIDKIEQSASDLDSRLRKQFTAMERSISQLQSQAGFLGSISR